MALTQKEIKQRYFDKKLKEAPMIACKCGCGEQIKSVDKYARPVEYVNGHNTRKYVDPTQHKREWNHRNREYRYNLKQKTRRKKKADLVQLKGGECLDCKYKHDGTNSCVFSFHHLDGRQKSDNINSMLMNVSWETILAELEKCVLLCENCHRLRHNGGW